MYKKIQLNERLLIHLVDKIMNQQKKSSLQKSYENERPRSFSRETSTSRLNLSDSATSQAAAAYEGNSRSWKTFNPPSMDNIYNQVN